MKQKILSPNKLDNEIKNICNSSMSTFCLVKIDPENLIKPKIEFNIDFEGNWIQRSIEDMYPFIKSDVIKKIMESK